MSSVLTALLALAVVVGPASVLTAGVYAYARHAVAMQRAEEEQAEALDLRNRAEAEEYEQAVAALHAEDRAWLEAHQWRAEGIEPGAEPAVLELPEVPAGPAQGAR